MVELFRWSSVALLPDLAQWVPGHVVGAELLPVATVVAAPVLASVSVAPLLVLSFVFFAVPTE